MPHPSHIVQAIIPTFSLTNLFMTVYSSGRQIPTPAVLAMGKCLKQRLPGPARIYPHDVLELGATTNAIGRALMQLGHRAQK